MVIRMASLWAVSIALNIVGRVRLGKAHFLGFFKHIGKRGAVVGHIAEDIVGGAVHDALDRVDPVGDQPLFHGLDDRDAAADARLEPDFHAGGRGGVEDLFAVDREQGLVGGDHMFAFGDGLEQKGAGGFHAPYQLNHDGYFRIVEDVGYVTAQNDIAELVGQSVGLYIHHPGENQSGPHFLLQPLALFIQRLGQAAADGTKTYKSCTDFFHVDQLLVDICCFPAWEEKDTTWRGACEPCGCV